MLYIRLLVLVLAKHPFDLKFRVVENVLDSNKVFYLILAKKYSTVRNLSSSYFRATLLPKLGLLYNEPIFRG